MGATGCAVREEDQLSLCKTVDQKHKNYMVAIKTKKQQRRRKQQMTCNKKLKEAPRSSINMPGLNHNVNNCNSNMPNPPIVNETTIANTTCFFTNADVLTNKMAELKLRVMAEAPGFIGINEVKPKNRKEIAMSLLKIPDYEMVYNTNIHEHSERGTIMYIHKNLISRVMLVDKGLRDSVFVEVKLGGNRVMLLGCIYRHHDSGEEEDAVLRDKLRSIAGNKKYSYVVLAGDFNLPGINWVDWCTSSANITREHNFIECIRDCFWYQHVTTPTRGRGTDRPSVLDLIFSDNKDIVSELNIQPPIGKSDHSVLSFKLDVDLASEKIMKPRFLYDKGNYAQMSEELGALDWVQIISDCPDTQAICSQLNKYITDSVRKHIPQTKGGKKKASAKTSLDNKALAKIKKKYKLWQRYLRTRSGEIYQEYCRIRNQVRRITRKTIHNLERDIAKEAKTNPKKFWAYVKSKLSIRNGIPDLLKPCSTDEEPQYTSTDAGKAEVLNAYFTSVFTREKDAEIEPSTQEVRHIMNELEVTPELVRKKLAQLKPSKSPGPDSIHPRVLRELKDVLAEPICLLFKASINEGVLPQDWKCSNITAIHKKGKKSDPGNYRPVSLTSILCKVLESIVREHIMTHMNNNDFFSDKQYGFLPGRSTTLQLLTVLDDWTEMLDEGDSLDVIYCDFKKAFDTVPHKRLLKKMASYGIDGKIHQWVSAFLTGRKQKVVVNGEQSSYTEVISGIPQGSVLGPLLFVLYINDLPQVIDQGSSMYLFADDTKVFRRMRTAEDKDQLDQDLSAMQDWSDTWLLQFHPDKCVSMHVGRSPIPEEKYTMGSNNEFPLNWSTAEKDVGVTFEPDMKFEKHIQEKINKANQMMGVIRKTFEYLDKETFPLLFRSLVRSHLEYANQVWAPHLKKHIEAIENVQRRATKQVPGLRELSYPERLKILDMPTLAYRRIRGDVIEAFKILSQDCGYDKRVTGGLLKLSNNSNTRGHSLKLEHQRARLDVRKYSFTHRVVSLWNSLPESMISAPNIETFKRRLDRAWRDQPVKYDHQAKFEYDRKPPDTEEDQEPVIQLETV